MLEEKLKLILSKQIGVDSTLISMSDLIVDDLGADSLDTVELIMEFEKEFNVSIPDDQAEQIQTVGAAIQYLEANAK